MGLKPLTSGGSNLVLPIWLRNEIMHDYLKAWQIAKTNKKYRTAKNSFC